MNLTIRTMQPDDIPSIATWMLEIPLWQRYGLTIDKAIANFEKGLARDDWLIVAELDDLVSGFAWVIPTGAFGRSPYLRLIGVKADKSGHGIGAELLNAVELKSAVVANDLFLLVSDFNLSAQAFYKRQGYVQIGVIDAYVLPDVKELLLRKRLK